MHEEISTENGDYIKRKKNSRMEKYNNWSEKLTDGLIRNWI